MPGERRPEASSRSSNDAVQVEWDRIAEVMRLLREAKMARAKATDAAIASGAAIGSTPVEIAKRDLGEKREPISIGSSEAIASDATIRSTVGIAKPDLGANHDAIPIGSISTDAAISSAPVGITDRALDESRLAAPIGSNEAIAKHGADDRAMERSAEPIATQPAPIPETVAGEVSSPEDLPSWLLEPPRMASITRSALLIQPAQAPRHQADASSSPAPLPSLEPIAKAPAEIQKSLAPESTSALPSPAPLITPGPPRVITYYRASDYMPVLDFETRALEFAARRPVQPLGRRLATWWSAIGSGLRGPWRDAVWDFYERMTDLFWWWRAVIKPVLKFLARFVPGREPETSRVSKAVEEELRCLQQPPPPWPPQWRSPRTRRHPKRRE